MTLRYSHQLSAYVGDHYRVDPDMLMRELRRLVDAGWEREVAFAALLDESSWDSDMPGVRPLTHVVSCLYCDAFLPRGRSVFCGTVCEATAYVIAFIATRPEV